MGPGREMQGAGFSGAKYSRLIVSSAERPGDSQNFGWLKRGKIDATGIVAQKPEKFGAEVANQSAGFGLASDMVPLKSQFGALHHVDALQSIIAHFKSRRGSWEYFASKAWLTRSRLLHCRPPALPKPERHHSC